jgi:hypothetical protein
MEGVARADETTAQQAERLFNEGNVLANSGNFASACPRYEESNRLDRAIGTEFNLADCYQNVGKTATALALFRSVEETAKAAGKVERQNTAHQRAEALDKLVARIRVTIPLDVPGLEVSCDDKPFERGDLGRPLPFDPGAHTVSATALARLPWRQSVQLVAGQTVEVAVPELLADPSVVTPVLVRRGGTQRTVALVTGGVGLAGVAVGAAFGILAIGDHSTAHNLCGSPTSNGPPASGCSSTGVTDWSNAVTAGNVSTAGFIVGGVALAAGVTLFLTAPKGMSRESGLLLRPEVGPGAGSLSLRGTW